MPHPAVRPDAVSRLQSRVGVPQTTVPTPADPAVRPASRPVGPRVPVAVRQAARRIAVPLLDRLATRVAAAGHQDLAALRTEVDQMRAELARLRTDFEAEVALLRAESAAR